MAIFAKTILTNLLMKGTIVFATRIVKTNQYNNMIKQQSNVHHCAAYKSPVAEILSGLSLDVLCSSPAESSAELENYSYENLFND